MIKALRSNLARSRVNFTGQVLAVALSSCVVAAQTLPNFSGTWEQITSSDPLITGQELTAVQTTTTLAVGHPSPKGGHQIVYNLDGSEARSTLMNIQSVAKVTIQGDKLTIARTDHYPDGRIRENTQVWSLDSAGNLVIDSADGTKGEPATVRKVVYKKRQLIKG